MNNKELIELTKKVFHILFESEAFDKNGIARYFSKEYVQSVDGMTLGYDDFICHVGKFREKVSSCRITFKTLVAVENVVFSNHIVDVTMRNGGQSRLHVLAEFRVRDGLVTHCDELTRLLSGDTSTENLGSVK